MHESVSPIAECPVMQAWLFFANKLLLLKFPGEGVV